jgi:hypothetical protein
LFRLRPPQGPIGDTLARDPQNTHFDPNVPDNVTSPAELRPDRLKRRANCSDFAAFFLDDGLADF